MSNERSPLEVCSTTIGIRGLTGRAPLRGAARASGRGRCRRGVLPRPPPGLTAGMEVDQDASARHVDLDLSLPGLYHVKHGVRLGLRQFEAHREAWHRPGRGRRSGPDHESEARVLFFGRTKSGRMLTILYTERRGRIRVVTAYEMTKAQQQMYFEGK